MQKQAILLGSDAVAHGVRLSRPQVISAYPITPQTHIIETLSEMVDKGEIKSQFIRVESEMSAIAAVLGSVSAGSRSFTASSSQGLAMMHELLHWFAGARLPLVLVNANRALGAPWNIWSDQSDSFSQRDTGWLQIYCETSQEALDTIIMAYKAGEQLMLPIMVMIDGFILSHTMERLLVPDQQEVDDYLPTYRPPYQLDPDNPMTFGAGAQPDLFYGLKKTYSETMTEALTVIDHCQEEFEQKFERCYQSIMRCQEGDEKSDTALLCCGAMTGTARVAVDGLRKNGISTDLFKLRLLRPFPQQELAEALKDKKRVIVLNRACSYGVGGTLSQEVRAALYHLPQRPLINDVMISLGGKEVFPETIAEVVKNRDQLSAIDCNWL
ncbi:MAG: transketolase C-terminal domain-containing protein [Pseudomonadota bacterium]|nr:transketolase C-terminal domain-containing protein [Pseudomonadota bacterium]